MTIAHVTPALSLQDKAGLWPDAEQRLLLHAALDDDRDAAGLAWREWAIATQLDHLDVGSYRLLPLAAHNLRRHGIETEWDGHLRGIRRRTWYEVQLLLGATAPAVDLLQAARIPILALKGAPLSIQHYPEPGARPMSDLDLLVPTETAEHALGALLAAGWEPWLDRLPQPHGSLPRSFRRFRHGVGLKSADGAHIDLHWHALYACCWDDADTGFWERAVPFTLHDRSILAMEATDQLLHACVHGVRWSTTPPIRWIADAVMVIRGGAVDWNALYARAAELRVQPLVALALEYIATELGAPVPPAIVAQLQSDPLGTYERQWLLAQVGPPAGFSAQYGRYLRAAPGWGPERWTGLPAFLHHHWRTSSPRAVPAEAARRALRRIPFRGRGPR